ncbi:MAG: glutamate mutase L, partial [bacterium]|nr:glutamate mutase L [bacterium]
TVVNAFGDLDTRSPRYFGQGVGATSVLAGDVTIGLYDALDNLKEVLGIDDLSQATMFATSSAAGGLRMTVHGLAFEMTARAAHEAALGAGAIVKMVTAGHLSEQDISELMQVRPNIILLAGGVDFGDKTTAIENAKKLALVPLNVPVIYAGNKACHSEIANIFAGSGKKLIIVANVYPRIDELNVEPARQAIQEVFEEHIVHAPGMERIREMVHGTIMPTPGAVMQAARQLQQSIGDLVVIDVGGATTDVHSVTWGADEIARITISPEPYAKRTVEGDLGVYINAKQVAMLIRPEESAKLDFNLEQVLQNWVPIPSTEEQFAALEVLARKAVE